MSRKSRLKAVAKRKKRKRQRPRMPKEMEQAVQEIAGGVPAVNMADEFKREQSAERPVIERDPSVPSGGVDLLGEP